MLERKLDIFIYVRSGGVRRVFTYRRWMLYVLLAVMAVLVAGGVFLWQGRAGLDKLEARRLAVLGRLAEQKATALRLNDRAVRLGGEMARITSFDAKLGVMVDRPVDRGGLDATPRLRPAAGLPAETVPDRRLFDFLDALGDRMAVEEVVQQRLETWLGERKLEFLAKPSLWPAKGYINSGFGRRSSPFGRGGDFHKGVDIKVPMRSPVIAAGAGRVTTVGYMHGYGLRVVVSHDYGLETVYAHLNKALVNEGDAVKRGQLIALSGNSGRTTGPHLHYEVRTNGTPVNPRQYLLD